MAFRKCDLKKSSSVFYPVLDWEEEVKENVPRDGGTVEVVLLLESSVRRSKMQLPPDKVRLHDIVASGNVIDPSNALMSLSPTDVSDLEDGRDRFASEMLEFMSNNEDSLIK